MAFSRRVRNYPGIGAEGVNKSQRQNGAFRAAHGKQPSVVTAMDNTMLTDLDRLSQEATFRYGACREEELEVVDKILFGNISFEDLPNFKSNVVRVYLCSMFTDSVNERNALMEQAYPRIRQILREQYGLEFSVVDLRWGIPALDDDGNHEFEDFALHHLKDCREDSLGPSFVALIGQKNGRRTLPFTVERMVFDSIIEALKEDGKDTTILEKWYIRDQNSIPNVYVLQSLSSNQDADKPENWQTVYKELTELLECGTKICMKKKEIDHKLIIKLQQSELGAEISGGIPSTERDYRTKNCACFFRMISDLPDRLNEKNAWKYIDFIQDTKQADDKLQVYLQEMKTEMNNLMDGSSNVNKSCIDWSGKEGVDPVAHRTYINQMCTLFEKYVLDLATVNSYKNEAKSFGDDVFREALRHWKIARMYSDNFSGRQSAIEKIKKYLFSDTRKILVLHGESGEGKSTLVAHAASQVQRILKEMDLPIAISVALRFLGTTTKSMNVYEAMRSICHQVAYTGNMFRHRIPTDMKGIKKYFMDVIQKGEFHGMLVLFLDSLEELVDVEDEHKLTWVPSRIAENVRIIITTKPGKSGVLDKLKSIIDDPEMFFELDKLDSNDCENMVKYHMKNNNRAFVYNQWLSITAAVKKCQSPLFIRLIFEEIRLWNSWTVVSEDALGSSVSDCLDRLLAKWEASHGDVLVKHCLSYLAVSKNGLSEAELLDLLSIDDVALNSLLERLDYSWQPPMRRFPPILWARLKQDIKPYLFVHEADNILVMTWRHAAMKEKINTRYMNSLDKLLHFHRHLADYYLGRWGGIAKKPFQYPLKMAEKFHLQNRNCSACRYVPEQPVIFITNNGLKKIYNLRKLSQLPYHLAKSYNHALLKSEVYFNHDWIYAKLKVCSLAELLTDYRYLDEREVNIVASALKMSEFALLINPEIIGFELSGRLLPHYTKFQQIQNLIDQCDLTAMKHCPLVPNFQLYTAPGGPLQYTCQVEEGIKSLVDVNLIHTSDSLLLAAKAYYSSNVRVWDVTQGEPKPDIIFSGPGEMFPTPDGTKLIMFRNYKKVEIYLTATGALLSEIEYGNGKPLHVSITNRYLAFTLEKIACPYVIDFDLNTLLHKMTYQSQIVALSQDGKYLICNAGHVLAVHEIPMMERKCVMTGDDIPKQIQFTKKNTKLFVLTGSNILQSVTLDIVNRKANTSQLVRDLGMKEFVLSHTEKYILARCARYLFVFDTKTETVVHRLQKMPQGALLDELSNFVGAGFTPNDSLVVAARATNLAVWDTKTGTPMRLLQVATTPIKRLFLTNAMNKAITLLENNSLQVWNFHNLCIDMQHRKQVTNGGVVSLSVSKNGKLVCHGDKHADAAVVDLGSTNGDVLYTFQHSEKQNEKIKSTEMGANGQFMITRGPDDETDPGHKPWSQLTEDKLWEVSSGKKLCTVPGVRYSTVSNAGNLAAFFQCRFFDADPDGDMSFNCVLYDTQTKEQESIDYPTGMLMSKPFFDNDGGTIIYLSQRRSKGIQLNTHTVVKNSHPIKSYSMKDINKDASPMDHFLDVWPSKVLLNAAVIAYSKKVDHFSFTTELEINRDRPMAKGILIVDLNKMTVLQDCKNLMRSDSNITRSLISRDASHGIDDQLRVFDLKTSKPNNQLTALDLDVEFGQYRLLMRGKYLAYFSPDKKHLMVLRTSDGVKVGSCFIHCPGTCLEIGHDDRMIIVGCEDGRVMVLSLILELADPVREFISYLPSRNKQGRRPSNMLSNDVKHASTSIYDQRRLATKMRLEKQLMDRKAPSFKTVATGALILNRTRQVSLTSNTINPSQEKIQMSKACTIQ
ncbi:NACHT and WD repeat domain-containing protein 2-like [Lineus longissimus]|uniref:NACHT and WD repeat domain-containing protein 2-like n=1 Tax=Lineus longissimus TaxID=88925 RepID=UPI002B4E6653